MAAPDTGEFAFHTAWLTQCVEPRHESNLSTIDPHNHRWGRDRGVRCLIEATGFAEFPVTFRADGDRTLSALGEVDFANRRNWLGRPVNAFKQLIADLAPAENAALLHDTAGTTYRLLPAQG